MNGNRVVSTFPATRYTFVGPSTQTAEQSDAIAASAQPWSERFERLSLPMFMLYVIALAIVTWLFLSTGWSFSVLMRGIHDVAALIERSWSLGFSRIDTIGGAIVETVEMAILGTAIGLTLSLFLAAQARGILWIGPIPAIASRDMVSLCGFAPDVAWAVIFVICFGPGWLAGTVTIAVCTIGYCGHFFADAVGGGDSRPREASRTLGIGKGKERICTILPTAGSALMVSSLFGFEKAVRSSMVIGLIGAGGIGYELKVAMDRFEYLEAAAIVLLIFVVVLAVERLGNFIRRKSLERIGT